MEKGNDFITMIANFLWLAKKIDQLQTSSFMFYYVTQAAKPVFIPGLADAFTKVICGKCIDAVKA